MLMMVKKHNFTPSGLAVFNVSTIFVMIVANAFFFPWCYKRLGAFLNDAGVYCNRRDRNGNLLLS